jgi:hypothetical protein
MDSRVISLTQNSTASYQLGFELISTFVESLFWTTENIPFPVQEVASLSILILKYVYLTPTRVESNGKQLRSQPYDVLCSLNGLALSVAFVN